MTDDLVQCSQKTPTTLTKPLQGPEGLCLRANTTFGGGNRCGQPLHKYPTLRIEIKTLI